jgi:hypothetical protein
MKENIFINLVKRYDKIVNYFRSVIEYTKERKIDKMLTKIELLKRDNEYYERKIEVLKSKAKEKGIKNIRAGIRNAEYISNTLIILSTIYISNYIINNVLKLHFSKNTTETAINMMISILIVCVIYIVGFAVYSSFENMMISNTMDKKRIKLIQVLPITLYSLFNIYFNCMSWIVMCKEINILNISLGILISIAIQTTIVGQSLEIASYYSDL